LDITLNGFSIKINLQYYLPLDKIMMLNKITVSYTVNRDQSTGRGTGRTNIHPKHDKALNVSIARVSTHIEIMPSRPSQEVNNSL